MAYGSSPSARSSGAPSRRPVRSGPGPGPGRARGPPPRAPAAARRSAPRRRAGPRASCRPSRLAPCIPPATSPAAYRPGDGRPPGLGIDPDPAHDVVGRRPDLHRALRDVDVGELLELLVHRGQLAPDGLGREVADVEEDAAVGRSPALLDLGVDGPRDVVAGRQLRRAAGVGLATLGQRGHPAGGLLVGRGVLGPAIVGEIGPHEPLAVLVAQDPALAADRLGHQQAADARRPDHPGRVELDELHVDELGARLVRERLAVAAVFPRVRGDLVGLADAAGRDDDRLGREADRLAGRPPVADGTGHPRRGRSRAWSRCIPCRPGCRARPRDPGASGSSRGRSGHRHGPGVDASGRRTGAAGSGRPASGRRRRPTARAR